MNEQSIMRPGGIALTQHALDLADIRSGGCLADIGCGLGHTVTWLVSKGYIAQGIDVSEECVSSAREAFPECSFQAAAAERMPFEDNCMDGMFMECTLSLFCREAALGEAWRCLRPDGFLIITDIYERSDAASDNYLSKPSIMCALERAGFRSILFEDHSPSLKQFIGRCIFEGNTDFLTCRSRLQQCGYYLLIAKKFIQEA